MKIQEFIKQESKSFMTRNTEKNIQCWCCDVAVAQINYPSLKHNTQDSIESIPRGRLKSDFYAR
jgi:hypothetical protein